MYTSSLVSIIIPHFNRSVLLADTIASVVRQTYPTWEIIIVDDGSSQEELDAVQKIVLTDNRVRFISRSSGVKGPSTCRNIGVNESIGEYLLFLDSDDLLSATSVANRVAYMEKNKQLDFAVFTQAVFEKTTGDKNIVFNKFFDEEKQYLESFIEDGHPWQTSGPIWRKDSFLSLGGFKESYTIMEDPELHIRALVNNLAFKVINTQPDFFYRMTPKNESDTFSFWENSIKGRVVFYKDLYAYFESKQLLGTYKKNIEIGVLNFIKYFLLSRSHMYKVEFDSILKWAKEKSLLRLHKIALIRIYHFLGKPNSSLSKIGLKGVVYKLI
jgi:glycosyltransferase involved in cell wall biosynthesis